MLNKIIQFQRSLVDVEQITKNSSRDRGIEKWKMKDKNQKKKNEQI